VIVMILCKGRNYVSRNLARQAYYEGFRYGYVDNHETAVETNTVEPGYNTSVYTTPRL
jgi:hypothetical protein